MAKVIAVANQKGGVAKTTTSINLATGLMLKGFKVLLVDTDPQCNSSDTYRAEIDGVATLYDVLLKKENIKDAIQHTAIGDILPCDQLLINAEKILVGVGYEYTLKKVSAPIMDNYDYIIIDTPPSLGSLLINALTFANSVIVPITTERYSLQGLKDLSKTIRDVKDYTNKALAIEGILLSKYNDRTRLSKEIQCDLPVIAELLNTTMFNTNIRESVSVREAQALRVSLFEHAPKSTTAQDYLSFIDELLERGN